MTRRRNPEMKKLLSLILALIAIAAIAVLPGIGNKIKNIFQNVNNAL